MAAGPPGADREPSSGEVLTGDLNLLRIQATVQYRVASPVDFVLRAEQLEPLLARSAEASISRGISAYRASSGSASHEPAGSNQTGTRRRSRAAKRSQRSRGFTERGV